MQTPLLPSLFTCILHYGNPALTAQVHEQLIHKLPPTEQAHICIIDNAAPEPYEGALRLKKNIFWGGALAYAVSLAQEKGYQYLWFCNNDIQFLSQGPHITKAQYRLKALQKTLAHPIGFWAPSVHISPYLSHMVQRKTYAYSIVPCIDGIAPVISLDCLAALGGLQGLGLKENTRGYGFDLWMSLQAHEKGWPVIVDHGMLIRHKYHTTASTVDGFMTQAAQDEEAFMQKRLGLKWREYIAALSSNTQHIR